MNSASNIELDNLRNKLISVFSGKSTVCDFIQLHKNSTITDINNKLFPLDTSDDSSESMYKTIAKIIKELDHEPQICLPKEMINSDKKRNSNIQWHDESKQEVLNEFKKQKKWKIITDTQKERESISDLETQNALIHEINDDNISKNLYWFISWSLRMTFAYSNPQWNHWVNSGSGGIFTITYIMYYIQAYKNRELFDMIIKDLPQNICQNTISFEIINNTRLTDNIVIRMVPWPTKLNMKELLGLWSCGIFPCMILLGKIKKIDNAAMSGPIAFFHDYLHTAAFVGSSKLYLRLDPFDREAIRKSQEVLSFGTKCYYEFVHIINDYGWSEKENYILFYLIHELIISTINKCYIIYYGFFNSIKIIITKTLENHKKSIPLLKSKYLLNPITNKEYANFMTKIKIIMMNIFKSQFKNVKLYSEKITITDFLNEFLHIADINISNDVSINNIPLRLDTINIPNNLEFTKLNNNVNDEEKIPNVDELLPVIIKDNIFGNNSINRYGMILHDNNILLFKSQCDYTSDERQKAMLYLNDL
jgi:hypothetical protein